MARRSAAWLFVAGAVWACGGSGSGGGLPGPGDAGADTSAADAGAGQDAGGEAGEGGPGSIDPRAFGSADLSRVTVAAFSQTDISGSDPQVLDLAPDIVPRAWGQWDVDGLSATDYGFAYPRACEAKGITFVGGLTASVMFMDEMSASDFADEVGKDATGTPVAHGEIVPGAYRGALASPGFRQRLIEIAELQIDGGVDGLFFDEVNSSYIGAGYDGDEGFDDHDVADFGRFLCQKHGSDPASLATFHFADADRFDCTSADPGAAFDYRGYLARLGVQGAPLGPSNPLSGEWGTTVQNRPDPSAGTFVETYPSLVYWQEIVLAVRTYARARYGKEILITANGVFPFVDFQSVGLYDYNRDAAGPIGFDYVPVTGTAPDVHFDGTVSLMPAFAYLRARSDRIVTAAGGSPVPLLLFLDWPTSSIDRYYAMVLGERQDYVRIVLAEAYAYGEWFALPLATTTDTNTATALGMMDFFGSMRAFYGQHADLFHGARDASAAVVVSPSTAASVATHATTLPDGRTVVHLVNHDYAAGFVPQTNLVVTVPLARAPATVTVASPDLPADQARTFTYDAGQVSVNVGTLVSSLVLVLQ